MSYVLGIDLSTRAIDLVLLDENTNAATWKRLTPPGATALERLLNVRHNMPADSFYDDVYLVAIEAPYGRAQPGTSAKLNRVFGAVVACLPYSNVWAVTPQEWRQGLGLKGNASKDECALAVLETLKLTYERESETSTGIVDWPQDALDAAAVAYYARETNRRAIEAAA